MHDDALARAEAFEHLGVHVVAPAEFERPQARDDGVHALLFDTQRRNARERGRLDQAHHGVDRLSAPAFERRGAARPNLNCIAGQDIDDDFECLWVADFGAPG